MSWIIADDPDEWETVAVGGTYGPHPCDPRLSAGWGGTERRRRPPEEVARIKAERQRKEEDEILRRADEIRTRRLVEHVSSMQSGAPSNSTHDAGRVFIGGLWTTV